RGEAEHGVLAREVGLDRHAREEHDPGARDGDRAALAPPAARDRRDGDGTEELDRDGRPERQVVDRDVEREVHRGERDPEDRDPHEVAARPPSAPRTAPREQEHRRRRDPQPPDLERARDGEQPHGDRRAEVLRQPRDDEEDRDGHPRGSGDGATGHPTNSRHAPVRAGARRRPAPGGDGPSWSGAAGQPLTEPARRPRTKYRWSATNTMSGTMIEMNAPAVRMCQSPPREPAISATRTVSG